jgi:hypothetical protein
MQKIDSLVFMYYILTIKDWDEYQKAIRKYLKLYKPVII